MKLTYIAALIASSLLTVGTATIVGNFQPAQANPCAAEVNPCAANPCAANPCAANPCAANPCAANPCAANPCAAATTTPTGSFTATAGKTAVGQAKVVEENGKRYLEFNEGFESSSGPDLFVLLHKQSEPQSYSSDQYVSLGRLQTTSGAQRYEIPADVSVDDFASAVIWCRQFNVTFGFATF